jgi:predicted nucleic-acid-binding protein
MIGLDTNILARYYIDDDADEEAKKQQYIAKKLIESKQDLMICKTVLLELEWVMRGYYGFEVADVLRVFKHLLTLTNVHIEDRELVEKAIFGLEKNLDFADALHHASYFECENVASFDDKKFAKRLNRLAILPQVIVPK